MISEAIYQFIPLLAVVGLLKVLLTRFLPQQRYHFPLDYVFEFRPIAPQAGWSRTLNIPGAPGSAPGRVSPASVTGNELRAFQGPETSFPSFLQYLWSNEYMSGTA